MRVGRAAGSGGGQDEMMTDSADNPLISAADLAELVASRYPPVLLDVRWVAGRPDLDDYLAGHLPGAVFLDLDADLAGPPGLGGRHPLPEPLDLQAVWRRAGIDQDSVVVAYDGKESALAARVWWLLRWSGLTAVRVLDGGFAAWATGDRPIETGPGTDPVPGALVVNPGGMAAVDADQALALAAGAGTLLDARAAARYRGQTEPIDPVAGHIPGSVNLPLTDLLTADGTFLSLAELESIFAALPGGDIAASCGSGVTACHLILAGAAVGREIALYPGSFSGWLALGRPVAVGPAPGPADVDG